MTTYSNTLAAARLQASIDLLAGGTLEFQNSSGTVLATLGLSSPAGTVSNKTLTFATISDDTSIDTTGTASQARIKDSSGNVHYSALTVGTSGAQVTVNTTSFVAGKDCSMSSCVITHP